GAGAKRDYPKPEVNEVLRQRVNEIAKARLEQDSRGNLPKGERKERYKKLYEDLKEIITKEANLPEGEEIGDDTKKLIKNYLADLQYDVVRDMILQEKVRLDGRGLADVRPLDME